MVDKIREAAIETVRRVRGSYDAPGFDACVEVEIQRMHRDGETGKTEDVQREPFDKTRESFETWKINSGCYPPLLKMNRDGAYPASGITVSWQAWQACDAAHKAQLMELMEDLIIDKMRKFQGAFHDHYGDAIDKAIALIRQRFGA